MTVWKYPLAFTNPTKVEALTGDVVHVGVDPSGTPTLPIAVWIHGDPAKQTATRLFHVFGTGHYVPDDMWHVGSVIVPPFVLHVFEESDD